MDNKYDILLLYGRPWDQPAKLSKHHFARLWAESNQRVLYVEAPINIFSFIIGSPSRALTIQKISSVRKSSRLIKKPSLSYFFKSSADKFSDAAKAHLP